MDLLKCLLYFALTGAAGFLLGRLLPKRFFCAESFPFRMARWEKEGAVYNRLAVRRWKEKLPDMSAILPKLMPSKKLPREMTAPQLERMVQETCVAEWIHGLLCLTGFGCVFIRKGIWGWIVSAVYMLCNIPFIIVQRYNRPKLVRILQRLREKESIHEKCDYFELQHGAGT